MYRKPRSTVARLLCLIICLSLFGQCLVIAAPETISVNVGNQTFQVTPGQWISINQGSRVLHYNVRYINGHPVALNESQYYQLVSRTTHPIQPFEKSIAEKVSESNPGVTPDPGTTGENAGGPSTKPVPFASTAEGKIQKSSIRAGLTTAVKVFGGKSGPPKVQPNGATADAQGTTPPSKVEIGLAKAGSKIRSGLDPKGILLRAGISVGVELATQIVRGEKPSAKKALGIVASAEFAGNIVGSAVGAAAGSFMVPFLSAVPVIGGALSALAPTFGAIAGGSYGAYLAGDLKNGKFSLRDSLKKMNWVDVTGRSVGATIGGFLGATLFPPFGIYIGGIIGGTVGAIVAKKLWGILGGKSEIQAARHIAVPGSNADSTKAQPQDDPFISIGKEDGMVEISSPLPTSEVLTPSASSPKKSAESAVNTAFSKYQELYLQYQDKVARGFQEEATEIGARMNQAKSEYERLKNSLAR